MYYVENHSEQKKETKKEEKNKRYIHEHVHITILQKNYVHNYTFSSSFFFCVLVFHVLNIYMYV